MEILKTFLFANTGYFWIFLISLDCFDSAWMDSASRKAAQADLHAAQFKPLNYKFVTEPCCHKMSERNRWKGRSELGFLPARSLLLLIYIESFVAPTSLCIFNLSELVWALRQQVVEKHSFNLQHMFRTTCLLPVLAQCCVIGMCCKILSLQVGPCATTRIRSLTMHVWSEAVGLAYFILQYCW